MEEIKQMITKQKKIVYMGLILSIVLAILVLLIFNNFLFYIQRMERLSKVEDNNGIVTLRYKKQANCQDRYVYTIDDTMVYYDCLDTVYISYGNTTAFLENALKRKYVTLEDLTKNTWQEKLESNLTLYYDNKKESPFTLLVDERENKKKVTFGIYAPYACIDKSLSN